jgi:hypothetical protein
LHRTQDVGASRHAACVLGVVGQEDHVVCRVSKGVCRRRQWT